MDTRRTPIRSWVGYGLTVLASCAFAWIAVLAVGGGKTAPTATGTALLWVFGGASIVAARVSLLWLEPAIRSTRRWEPFVLCLVTWLVAAVVVPVLMSAKAASKRSSCLSNTKQNGLALLMYAADFDDRLPLETSWQDASASYWSDGGVERKCPEGRTGYSYALNQSAAKKKLEEFEDQSMVMVFECDAYLPNPSGRREWFVPRHWGVGAIARLSGTAKMVKPNDPDVRWKP